MSAPALSITARRFAEARRSPPPTFRYYLSRQGVPLLLWVAAAASLVVGLSPPDTFAGAAQNLTTAAQVSTMAFAFLVAPLAMLVTACQFVQSIITGVRVDNATDDGIPRAEQRAAADKVRAELASHGDGRKIANALMPHPIPTVWQWVYWLHLIGPTLLFAAGGCTFIAFVFFVGMGVAQSCAWLSRRLYEIGYGKLREDVSASLFPSDPEMPALPSGVVHSVHSAEPVGAGA